MGLKLCMELVLASLLLYDLILSVSGESLPFFFFFLGSKGVANRLVSLEQDDSTALVSGGEVVAGVVELDRGDDIS